MRKTGIHKTRFFCRTASGEGEAPLASCEKFNLEGALEVCLSLIEHLQRVHGGLQPNQPFHPYYMQVNDDGSVAERHAISMPLAYMSPEQTGRMNRESDYRSDYYSLGVLLFELLTGRPPFESDDVMELVHSHIARKPAAPSTINAAIPAPLCNIVLKLLSKNAEDRYQSLEGLRSDVERCQAALLKTSVVPEFKLAEHDVCDRLQIPQKLYGREREVRQLVDAFNRTTETGAEFLLVTGYSGIGKTSLVNEIHKPVIARRGYFISGKFDRFGRTIPYSAIIHALRELMRQILTESESEIVAWREKLLDALGQNGHLLAGAIPELELVIGKQDHVAQAGAGPNQYSYVMQSFVGVFTRPEHPLVLFLDDLQWADAASLKLISLLMNDLDAPCFLLIGAYRDNEVDATHPLMLSIYEIKKTARVRTIELSALSRASLSELLADTVKTDRQAVASLSQLIYHKTLGNPFFVRQFLKSIYIEDLLQFDGEAWRWDVARIEALGITDNVVDLLTTELHRLPEASRLLLNLAACIGDRFDLDTLASVSEETGQEALMMLQPPIYAGLIRIAERGLGITTVIDGYCFPHDRVRQAAYLGIPEQEKKAVHLKIGQSLLLGMSKPQREERIFDIVHQLNLGRSLLTRLEEKDELARLNLNAAKKARKSAAFEVHRELIGIALECSGVSDWRSKQEFMHELYMELVNGAFARADYPEMERLCKIVCDNSLTSHGAISARNMLIRCYGALYKPDELLKTGIESLTLAGIEVPAEIGWRDIWLARAKLALALRGRNPLALAQLAPATDPQYLLKLQASTSFLAYGFTYLADSKVVLWVALEIIRLSIRHGPSPACAYAFLVWGRTLAGRLGKPAAGYQFGKLAVAVSLEKAVGAAGIFQGIIRHHQEPLHLSLQPLMDAAMTAMAVGDRVGAMVALSFSDSIRFQSGANVEEALTRIRKNIGIYRRMDYQALLGVMIPWALLFARLVGESVEESVDELSHGLTMDEYVAQRQEANDPWGVFYVRAIQSTADYYFGDYADALRHAEQAIALPGFDFGTPSSGFLMFFYSLSALAHCGTDRDRTRAVLMEVGKMQRRFKSWARRAPMNYQHKWRLVEAERWRVLGQAGKAARCFDLAIDEAAENGFTNDVALAHELAGKFYAGLGKSMLARTHMEEAHVKYREWGAHAKAGHLESTYPALLARMVEKKWHELDRHLASAGQRLDIDTVIKASQTLSGEIQLDKLLEKLMRLLIENAGAQKGVLLMQKDGVLAIRARAQDDVIVVLQGDPLEERADLSFAIVNYVKHTGVKVVLGDAGSDAQFKADRYIRRVQPRSLLCIPLKKQGELVGILYLENNLAVDAFTPEHTELLEILSTQITISLENAELYNELEQKIVARTHALSEKNSELNQTLKSLRQMQKQLVESEKLASLGQLVAGVAHEINTPVGVGITAASTLAEETGKLHAAYRDGTMKRSDLDNYINTAATISKLLLSNMERAATLIQSFKEVAIDQTSEERRSFSLKSYIEEVLLNLNPMLRKSDCKVEVDCPDEIKIDTYPGALSQILTNFVMNALLHAFPEGQRGTISIVVSEPDSSSVALRFSDDGKGIPAKNLPKIFDPFFTTMRGKGGSGLGLNIVHNLVTGSLQGQVAVHSTLNAGTTFVLNFPRNPTKTTVPENKGA